MVTLYESRVNRLTLIDNRSSVQCHFVGVKSNNECPSNSYFERGGSDKQSTSIPMTSSRLTAEPLGASFRATLLSAAKFIQDEQKVNAKLQQDRQIHEIYQPRRIITAYNLSNCSAQAKSNPKATQATLNSAFINAVDVLCIRLGVVTVVC